MSFSRALSQKDFRKYRERGREKGRRERYILIFMNLILVLNADNVNGSSEKLNRRELDRKMWSIYSYKV